MVDIPRFSDKLVFTRLYWTFMNALDVKIILFIDSFQVLIIQFGGDRFSTVALSIDQWLWCLFFGIGELLWGQVCFNC